MGGVPAVGAMCVRSMQWCSVSLGRHVLGYSTIAGYDFGKTLICVNTYVYMNLIGFQAFRERREEEPSQTPSLRLFRKSKTLDLNLQRI